VTRHRVVLLDVDGTLVLCAGAGRRSLERAVAEELELPATDLSSVRLDGSTDRLIVRHAMGLLGRPFDEAGCDRLLLKYVGLLPGELHAPGYRVLPGVVAALELLRDRGVAHGVCTGNVREGARLKLRHGGLDGFFEWGADAVGGFAEDGEVRARIVEAAIRRAAARVGPFALGEVLVVGDTPLDVQAGHEAGCEVLGVATGKYGRDDLRAAGADHVVENLEDPAALRLMLGSDAP
jgi:phosphoglycolate phosphatase-like HAD superfamily hydrolase